MSRSTSTSAAALLAGEMGNGTTEPGLASIYELNPDCRHPILAANVSRPRAFGHEASWSPDGRTFWVNGGIGIAAIGRHRPAQTRSRVWEGNEYFPRLERERGTENRVYVAEPIDGQLLTLDVSDIQAPQARSARCARSVALTWNSVAIPPETPRRCASTGTRTCSSSTSFAWAFHPGPAGLQLGRRGADRRHGRRAPPRGVVSNLRLEINQPEQRREAQNDPGAQSLAQGYAAHYCAVPREVDPEIVACSFINSGLRIFDVARTRLHPTRGRLLRGAAGHRRLQRPAGQRLRDVQAGLRTRPARGLVHGRETRAFYAVRLTNGVWPHPAAPPEKGDRVYVAALDRHPPPAAPGAAQRGP